MTGGGQIRIGAKEVKGNNEWRRRQQRSGVEKNNWRKGRGWVEDWRERERMTD